MVHSERNTKLILTEFELTPPFNQVDFFLFFHESNAINSVNIVCDFDDFIGQIKWFSPICAREYCVGGKSISFFQKYIGWCFHHLLCANLPCARYFIGRIRHDVSFNPAIQLQWAPFDATVVKTNAKSCIIQFIVELNLTWLLS